MRASWQNAFDGCDALIPVASSRIFMIIQYFETGFWRRHLGWRGCFPSMIRSKQAPGDFEGAFIMETIMEQVLY
jgi:hypothetical protein